MVTFQSQKLNYSIWIVEQSGNDPFNRAQLLNIAVAEVMKAELLNETSVFNNSVGKYQSFFINLNREKRIK
jgi:hypothetical protein